MLKTQIVVVGGGAGGLKLAKLLGKRLGSRDLDVILIDRNRTHVWKPLLHEVAAGSLDASMDEVSYGQHGHRWGYRFFYGTLESVDRDAQTVTTAPILDEAGNEIIARQSIRYDHLVLAIGSVSNDFGTPGVDEHCLFLEDREQADQFRLRLLNRCLSVARSEPSEQQKVRIAIVGAGATGVELAAELYDAAEALKLYGLEVFDESLLEVVVVEAGPRILPALPERLANAAHASLKELGVDVRVGSPVTQVAPGALIMGDGTVIAADLLVWAAGVRAPNVMASVDVEKNRINQVVVKPTLQSVSDDRIFAIGDCCSFTPEGESRPIPPRAQAAQQMAATAYHNIAAIVRAGPLRDFVYRDRGSLVSISRYFSFGNLMGKLLGKGFTIEGRLARAAYVSLYHLHLLGVHGWIKGTILIAAGHINKVIRPRFKLH